MGFLLDTTFLIDLEREGRAHSRDLRNKEVDEKSIAGAHHFLRSYPNERCDISVITAGEFAAGFSTKDRNTFQNYLSHFSVLDLDHEIAWLFGQHSQRLRKVGKLIGANDLWIGCSALRYGLAVVTRNVSHFSRIDGLECIGY